jgi:carbon-monoxide dehydrogenase medium subunit
VLLEDFPVDVDFGRVQESAQKAISPIDDVRCTAEYRAFMVNVFIKRLLGEVA